MKNKISIEDFRIIAKGLQAAFPRDDFMPNEYTFNLWYTALQDIPYPTLNKACTSYIMGYKFPPTIAEIRQIAYDLDAPGDEIAAEEWSNLMKALGHAWSTDAEGYWKRLPEITREIVGSFSEYKTWANMPTAELMSVQRPMFIKRYEEKERVRRFRGALPFALTPPVRQLTEQTVARLEEKTNTTSAGVEAPASMIEELRRRLAV